MKKILVIVLAIFLAISLIACEYEQLIFAPDIEYINKAVELTKVPTETKVNITLVLEQTINIDETKLVKITWQSSDQAVIDENGIITRSETSKSATLTATFQLNQRLVEKDYLITIIMLDHGEPIDPKGPKINWEATGDETVYLIYINDVEVDQTVNNEYVITGDTLALITNKTVHLAVKYLVDDELINLYDKNVSYSNQSTVLFFDFEKVTIDKTGYASGFLEDQGIKWHLSEALNGGLAQDKINGLKSIRMRGDASAGVFENETPIVGAQGFSFYHAKYDGGEQRSYQVEIKDSQSLEWQQIYTTETVPAAPELLDFKLSSNYENELYIRITTTMGSKQRINFDDFHFYKSSTDYAFVEVDHVPDYEKWRAKYAQTRKTVLEKKIVANGAVNLTEYYQTININSETLRNDLKAITTDNFTGINYNDARFVLEEADLDFDALGQINNEKMRLIFTGKQLVNVWDEGNSWAREHVWPHSRLGAGDRQNEIPYVGSDIHNLRAINPKVNGEKSNKPLIDGSGEQKLIGSSYFPGELDKGDVARILLYMVVKYDYLRLTDFNLILLTSESGAIKGAKNGLLSILLKWHQEDEVDDFERHRNQLIFEYQNNRNPFIDRPEFFEKIFAELMASDTNPYITSYIVIIDWNRHKKLVIASN